MINYKGPNTEPRCSPTWTRKSSLKALLTLNKTLNVQRLWTYLYILCILTNLSSTPTFLKAHYTSLAIWSKDFSKSKWRQNWKQKYFFFVKYFMDIVLHLDMKPSLISSISTSCVINRLLFYLSVLCSCKLTYLGVCVKLCTTND